MFGSWTPGSVDKRDYTLTDGDVTFITQPFSLEYQWLPLADLGCHSTSVIVQSLERITFRVLTVNGGP